MYKCGVDLIIIYRKGRDELSHDVLKCPICKAEYSPDDLPDNPANIQQQVRPDNLVKLQVNSMFGGRSEV